MESAESHILPGPCAPPPVSPHSVLPPQTKSLDLCGDALAAVRAYALGEAQVCLMLKSIVDAKAERLVAGLAAKVC